MTKEEELFAKQQGPLWNKAMIAATLHIRKDSRFISDKIRGPAIEEATFKAFGRQISNRCLANMVAREGNEAGVMTYLDKLIEEAAKEAKKAIKT